MTRVTIAVPQRPYEAWIENGLLSRAGTLLREILPPQKALFVVTVGPVRRKWGKTLIASLQAADFRALPIEMPDGETQKKITSIVKLDEKLSTHSSDRITSMLDIVC